MKSCKALLVVIVGLHCATANALVEPSPSPPPAAVVSPDNAKGFDAATATQAWLDTVPPDKRERSDSYFEGGYWLILWNFLLTAAISILFLARGWSAGIRNWTERTSRRKGIQVMLYSAVFLFLSFVLSFPLTVYQYFFREHAYGLATQTFMPWFLEQLLALAVNVVVSALLLVALYAVFRRAPKTWWAWGTALTILFFAIGQILFPVFVSPLFNTYRPVTDPAVRDPILTLARANQIPVDNVYEFDASRQTTRVSANVSGFLSTTRISLNDNLLNQCSLQEIRYVMGHEMGHYVLNHSPKLVMGLGVVTFLAFVFLRFTFDWSVRKWGARWDVRGIADPAGLPLIILLVSLLGFLGTPIVNTLGRNIEIEADIFGLNTTREADGMAQASLKLGTYRKLNPGYLEEVIFYDHPSGRARIRMAMDWKAAQLPCGSVQR